MADRLAHGGQRITKDSDQLRHGQELTGAQVPAPQCLGQRQLCLGIQHLVLGHGIPFAALHLTPLPTFSFSINRIRSFLKSQVCA